MVALNNQILYNTVREALADGWKRTGERTLQRGYTSRVIDPEETPVYAGGGSREGQAFYLAPNNSTVNYCYRCYLRRGRNV